MAVKKLSATESVEALVYDLVFIDVMTTTQALITNDSQDPKYTVEITYRMYALALSGDMYFKNEPKSVKIEDFYGKALTDAAQNDMTYANGLSATEAVIAKAISDAEGISTEVI